MANAALRGKPDAENPHVRFDEGDVASAATPEPTGSDSIATVNYHSSES